MGAGFASMQIWRYCIHMRTKLIANDFHYEVSLMTRLHDSIRFEVLALSANISQKRYKEGRFAGRGLARSSSLCDGLQMMMHPHSSSTGLSFCSEDLFLVFFHLT